jgi:hypothetical protein
MVGQTSASFTTLLGRQGTASTDSLINSLVDTSAPPSPAPKKATITIPPSTLKGAPAGKAEAAAAGIRRVDNNIGALASRLEDLVTRTEVRAVETQADIESVRTQVTTFANDLAGSTLSAPAGPSFGANDMLAHPTVRALIQSNNATVGTIETLRQEVATLRTEILSLHESTKRKRQTDDGADNVFLPAVKRISPHATTVVGPSPLPPVALVASLYDQDLPAAPPALSYDDAAPGSVPEAPPPIAAASSSANSSSAVDIGPMLWGKDISGQVRGLVARMARASTIDADAVRKLYAKRFPKNNRFITAFFPTNVAAIQFVNAWAAAPPAGYEKVSVSFSSGN